MESLCGGSGWSGWSLDSEEILPQKGPSPPPQLRRPRATDMDNKDPHPSSRPHLKNLGQAPSLTVSGDEGPAAGGGAD